jgi:mono/diheme cytochrome c family protein
MSRSLIRFVSTVCILLAVQTAFALQGSDRRSTADGAYTEEQARRGERAFIGECGGCHAPDQFVGEFLMAWSGKSASDLLEMIKEKMPQDRPGSLPRQQYADILAFMFEKNGFPAGKQELPAAQADLERVAIEMPKAPERIVPAASSR